MTGEFEYRLRRIGRRLVWPRPWLYLPVGILRRGMGWYVFDSKHSVYISGYPRSGNTFAVNAFHMANPGIPLRSHKHIPTFVVVSTRRGTPGMVVIRHPLDASVSWAIYKGKPLHLALQYYEDYYSVLLPYRDRLFIVRFEDVVADFGQVLRAFNARWGTSYNLFVNSPDNIAACMTQIEDESRQPDGSIPESRVARPSQGRSASKQALIAEAGNSPRVREALRRAQGVYDVFSALAHRNDKTPGDTSATRTTSG